MIDTVLFDLDGTLLPMDNDVFLKTYFKALAAKLAGYGYDPQNFVDAVWRGTGAMVKNDGTRTNEAAFWATFEPAVLNWDTAHRDVLESFYANEFHTARESTAENPLARPLVQSLLADGLTVALATNPLFPPVGVASRLSWIDLQPDAFALVTTYDNMHFCKPNPRYFLEIAEMLGKTPESCLMVGNNVSEDIEGARAAGMRTLLVTDCLINETDTPLSAYEATDFAGLSGEIRRILSA